MINILVLDANVNVLSVTDISGKISPPNKINSMFPFRELFAGFSDVMARLSASQ